LPSPKANEFSTNEMLPADGASLFRNERIGTESKELGSDIIQIDQETGNKDCLVADHP